MSPRSVQKEARKVRENVLPAIENAFRLALGDLAEDKISESFQIFDSRC
jgi:hypothetical protein